ncbi:hypothetical protein ACJX0J_007028, partial [Zea mays]
LIIIIRIVICNLISSLPFVFSAQHTLTLQNINFVSVQLNLSKVYVNWQVADMTITFLCLSGQNVRYE